MTTPEKIVRAAIDTAIARREPQKQTCRGFVPKHGFGQARTCASCGNEYDDHQVVEQ